jgi:hypothetical protein
MTFGVRELSMDSFFLTEYETCSSYCIRKRLSASVVAQKLVDGTDDWTGAFPEVPGCVRVIGPMNRTGKTVEQTANYERGLSRSKDPNYVSCGSVTLRLEPNARRNAQAYGKAIGFGPYPSVVKGFFALRDGPLCGNDSWLGSTSVFFDKDKVVIVSANQGAEALFTFLESVDFPQLRNQMSKFE